MDKNFVILWNALVLIMFLGVVCMNLADALKSDYESCIEQRQREVNLKVVQPITCECKS